MAGFFDLFGPATYNRLLQPDVTTQGIPNMLLSRPSPQSYPIAPVPQTDPMQTASIAPAQAPAPIAPPMAAPAAPQAQPGIRDLYSNFINSDRGQALNDMFTGWAAGSTPSESLAFGAKLTAANKKDRDATNQTVAWLKGKGLSDADAHSLASSPPALNEYLKSVYQQKKPLEVNGQLVDPDTFQVLGDFRTAEKPAGTFRQLTADEVKSRGLDPTKSYQVGADGKVDAIGGGGITINNSDGKLPANFRWIDPNNPDKGVEPIPGGPAEQIPAETAGRIGLADNFLKQLPDVQKDVQSGTVTGLVDRWTAVNNSSSSQAGTYQKIQSGVDALTRMLTGAGQNKDEAAAYAARYLPSYTDDAASASRKLDQLADELRSAKALVLRGHAASATQPSDPLGIR
jgi:hypothetical protein